MNISSPQRSELGASDSRDYYEGPDLVEALRTAIQATGRDPDSLKLDDLAGLDEFHALGRAATIALGELAGVRAGERVLDVGAGLGGPARVLATRYGATVTALDATPRFQRACDMLSRATGVSDRVITVHGDALALPFSAGAFDLVWTQAVGQNIADKPRFISELARVVAPAGRIALFEILAGPGGELQLPVPWADRPEQSWLVSGQELRALIEDAGLRIVEWNEGSDALQAIAGAAGQVPPAVDGLGLELLLPDFNARMAGLAANVAAQNIVLLQAVVAPRH
jgi:SAM-dependent methyltransferase